jgi:hypothetical protein
MKQWFKSLFSFLFAAFCYWVVFMIIGAILETDIRFVKDALIFALIADLWMQVNNKNQYIE